MKTKHTYSEDTQELEMIKGFERYITNDGTAPLPCKDENGKYVSAQVQARFYGFEAAWHTKTYVSNNK